MRYERILVKRLVFEKGVGHFECKFQGEGGSSTIEFWRKNYTPWAITWCCLRDPTFSRFDTIPACDTHRHTHRQTDRQTDKHKMMAITRGELAL